MSTDSIVYRDITSPLGDMIAGATENGVCFLEWHDRGGVERIKQRVEKRYRMPLAPTWDRLLSIQYGKTRSYGEMADLLGKPRASRAVGRANGANYISIVVPCHRVIETNGGLGGYGGGIKRKRYLLDLEAGNVPTGQSSLKLDT